MLGDIDVRTAKVASKTIALSGDRPTGNLHLGHLVGSLNERVKLQHTHDLTVMIADMQALTVHADNPARIEAAALELMLDYLSVGLEPEKVRFVQQSGIPALAELFMLYLNLVSVNRLQRNPTIKSELAGQMSGRVASAGFVTHPVSQAADITAFRATAIPVGEDQLPLLEQANEIVDRVNALQGRPVLPSITPILSRTPRLMGIDGAAKCGKSSGNAIFLKDTPDVVVAKVQAMFTDPQHLKASDPGRVEGNVVIQYLDALDDNAEAMAELKLHYQRGGLGDAVLKKRLVEQIEAVLNPIRRRRAYYLRDLGAIKALLRNGTMEGRTIAHETLTDVRAAFRLAA